MVVTQNIDGLQQPGGHERNRLVEAARHQLACRSSKLQKPEAIQSRNFDFFRAQRSRQAVPVADF